MEFIKCNSAILTQSQFSGDYNPSQSVPDLKATSRAFSMTETETEATDHDIVVGIPRVAHIAQLKIRQMAKVFRRLVLLAYVCIASSLTVILLSFLVFEVFVDIIDTQYGYTLDLVYWTMIFGDNVINIACISLQFDNFGYFDWIYNHCCKSCEKHLKLFDSFGVSDTSKVDVNVNTQNPSSV